MRPSSIGQICTGNDRIVLVGEAAGFISPSSAEGLSYAFRSSLSLSKAFEKGLDGLQKRYREHVKSLERNILLKHLKSPAMYSSFLRKIIMNMGIMSIDME